MALKSISLENFRGKESVNYDFSPTLNVIKGKNGAGKSTIKEAICFVFTGTDSIGTRNPTHLITRGKTALKVSVTTDKATIIRTLTEKGNGTVKLVRDGVEQTVTQTQLETMLGSTDVFLSIFLPGFFLDLKAERQHKVISDIRPKVDRMALFTELAGFELTAEEKIRYSLTRRIDLVASDVAKDRREFEKQGQVKQGEVNTLESLKPLPKPTPIRDFDFSHAEILKEQWATYKRESNSYRSAKLTHDGVALINEQRAARKKEITEQLESIKLVEVPVYSPIDIDKIREEFKRPLAEPSLTSVVDSDTCPSCSQVVKVQHRERVRKQNEELLETFKLEEAKVVAHNDWVNTRIAEAQVANKKATDIYLAALDKNKSLQSTKQKLEIEQAGQIHVDAIPLPAEPVAPSEVFDEAVYAASKKLVDDYNASVSQYEYVQKQFDQSQAKIAEAKVFIDTVNGKVAHLKAIEDVLGVLPQHEVNNQIADFDIGNIKLSMGTEIAVAVDGMPYELLSTGNSMKTGVAICRKIDSMMARPLGMVFLDNADLVDVIDLENVQAFLAEVTNDEEVKINE